MAAKTRIQWTDHTFNPWWGCAHVSPGCVNCYAEKLATRYGNDVWGARAPRRFFSEKYWAEPLKWNREAESEGRRQRVFCASMADVFEARSDLDQWREKLWKLIAETPRLDWQLLTKRPDLACVLAPRELWQLPNVWLGTSVENQEWADKRIPFLLRIPAQVRFLSCEPLVGPVSFRWARWAPLRNANHLDGLRMLDWIIVGGESGPHARRMKLEWAVTVVEQCQEAGVPVFVKQLGAAYRQPGDSHGADMTYWPADLRVRQMPSQKAAGLT